MFDGDVVSFIVIIYIASFICFLVCCFFFVTDRVCEFLLVCVYLEVMIFCMFWVLYLIYA